MLDITDEDLGNLITAGLRNVAAACLELNYPTIASVRAAPTWTPGCLPARLAVAQCAVAAAGRSACGAGTTASGMHR